MTVRNSKVNGHGESGRSMWAGYESDWMGEKVGGLGPRLMEDIKSGNEKTKKRDRPNCRV